MKMKSFFYLVILIPFISSAYWLTGCNTTEPPPPDNRKITLTFEDASCIETWLKIQTENVSFPAEVTIKRDSSVEQNIMLNSADTVVYIDSLLPNKTYSFQSVIQPFNQSGEVKSNELTVTTMDTTSHNFTWQTWTFGGNAGSSTLYDVAIIDENNIWAVGEINIADTSENGYTKYCYLKWNGNDWEKGKLKYFPPGSIGDSITTSGNSIFAFSEDDVWISGGAVFHWNGTRWKTFYNTGAEGANKIWGTSSNDLYVVGNNGSIAHYNGSQWNKIESGTDLDINDIWGDYNDKTGEWEILTVGGNILQGFESERVILKINNNKIEHLIADGTKWPLISLWFKSNRKYYVIGSGIYEKKFLSDILWKDNGFDITHYTAYRIRGNRLNDVMLVGAFGESLHFNGITWKSYIDQTMLNAGRFYGVNIKENIIIAVGQDNPRAVITMGKRIN